MSDDDIKARRVQKDLYMAPRVERKLEGCSIYQKPHGFTTKKGDALLIRTLDEETCRGLTAMYLAFQPRNSFQGLPPVNDAACVKWVQYMVDNGVNLVALALGEKVVGHAGLFPIDEEVCEMLVVVSPQFQNSGIGTQLTRSIAQLAYEMGFDRIWLPVEAVNSRARHVYTKCGFHYLQAGDQREREMALDLRRYHEPVQAPIADIMDPDVESSPGSAATC